MLLLGDLMTFVIKSTPLKVTFPRRGDHATYGGVGCFVSLFWCWAVLPFLGYVPSSCLTSIVLFRLFGAYRWRTCLMAAVLLTGSLYLVFIRFLKLPFPIGIFGM